VETYATNVMGTVNVLEAVRSSPDVRAVVVVTSDKCYENRESTAAYREGDPLGGRDPYSSSKGAAELVTAAYRASFFPRGAAAVASARAGNVIGGGDWTRDRLIPDLVRAIEQRRTVAIRNPGAIRPWQHVLEPLHGYLSLAERLCNSGDAFASAWNFGPGEEDCQPVRSIVERLAAEWGGELRWEADAGAHPHEAGILKLDSAKARRELAWQPRWKLDKALRSVVAWHKAHAAGADMREVTLAQIREYMGPSSP
jgi:CDP-glucose 4,6-dehydratase